MAESIQTLISNIPTAEDGHTITREYHNSLRAAIVALAQTIGTGSGPVDNSITYAPVFLPVTDGGSKSAEWVLSVGIASRPTNVTSAKGWFPLQVPDTARIKSMTVTGQRAGSVLACQVKLMRQTIVDSTTVPIATVNLKNVSGQPFKSTADVSGPSAAIIDDFQTVNNNKYQYIILAEVNVASPSTDAIVDLFAIQIGFGTTFGFAAILDPTKNLVANLR